MKKDPRQEVINYLENASKHIFITEDGKYQTIIKVGKDFYAYKDEKLTKIYFEKSLEYYGGNTKNVIKHSIFSYYPSSFGYGKNSKLKAVKYNKYLRQLVNEAVEALAEKLSEKEMA
ncbi:MAG: hypothetical protein NUV97_03495 [archaeon]|nr:hypothetical protein [archaeon]